MIYFGSTPPPLPLRDHLVRARSAPSKGKRQTTGKPDLGEPCWKQAVSRGCSNGGRTENQTAVEAYSHHRMQSFRDSRLISPTLLTLNSTVSVGLHWSLDELTHRHVSLGECRERTSVLESECVALISTLP